MLVLSSSLTLCAEDLKPSSLQVAETVLAYQRQSGGWPKNYNRKEILTPQRRAAIIGDRGKNDATIDNGATHQEIRLVANAFIQSKDHRYNQATIRGIRYLLSAQYDNGGWPQRYPNPRGYHGHITFNDGAMIGVMRLLHEVAWEEGPFSFVSADLRRQCQEAVDRGVQCILKCQIQVNGKLTAWCAQHDASNLEPRKARSYELPSLSGSESVGVVRFLMQLDQPSPEVVQSIESAIAWFERSKLRGIRQVRVKAPDLPGGRDTVVLKDPEAPPMWARFYDIPSNQPIFCSRDGIPRKSLSEISHERRNGYSWLGYYARNLLEREYPAWQKSVRK